MLRRILCDNYAVSDLDGSSPRARLASPGPRSPRDRDLLDRYYLTDDRFNASAAEGAAGESRRVFH